MGETVLLGRHVVRLQQGKVDVSESDRVKTACVDLELWLQLCYFRDKALN